MLSKFKKKSDIIMLLKDISNWDHYMNTFGK